MIKAIIFDLDGVLLDAKEWHYEALNMALRLFGHNISRYEHLLHYDGLPTKKKLEMLSVEKGLPDKLHEFINEMKQKYTTKLINEKCHPVFSHEYALSRLKNEGYLLAVGTNSVRKTLEFSTELLAIEHYFDLMISWEDVEQPKPSPLIYETAIKRLQVKPFETLILEDNSYGVEAAQNSQAHVMIVKNIHEVTYNNIMNFIKSIT